MIKRVSEDAETGDVATALAVTDETAAFVAELAQQESTAPEATILSSPPETIGSLLRSTRLARGLTIVDVTHAIKFGARQIEALERDDFDKLPGATFVRGVIRSYGKFLGLEESQLLDLLGRQLAPVESEVQAPEDTGATIPVTSERRSALPWMALVVMLAAIGVALATFFDWPSSDKAKLAHGPKVQPPTVRVEQEAASEQAGVASAQVPPADSRQLIFIFDDKAWVEVKDATQKIIFAQNNAAGTRQLVVGRPPFDLVIGNASAVQLQYEDKVIDLRPHTKVEVARLSLE